MDVEVTRAAIATLIAEARRSGGSECCGLLVGGGGAPGRPERIVRAIPAANVHPDPARRFEIGPAALIAAHRAMREGGPELLGYYHSHPGGDPVPSPCDREQAAGDGRLWAIVAGGRVLFWRDLRGGFVPVAVRAVDG